MRPLDKEKTIIPGKLSPFFIRRVFETFLHATCSTCLDKAAGFLIRK